MPVDITALVILIVVLLPGAVGEWIYRSFVGVVSWRDTALNTTFRLLGFSLAGATIYAFISRWLGLPPPNHLFPTELSQFGPTTYLSFFVPITGHVLSTVTFAFAVVGCFKAFTRASKQPNYHTTWDDFINERVKDRWVAVSLKGGAAYIGKLATAEELVKMDERDITLEEPAFWSPKDYNYIALNYQYLYLPASTIDSIGAYTKPSDERSVKVGDKVF